MSVLFLFLFLLFDFTLLVILALELLAGDDVAQLLVALGNDAHVYVVFAQLPADHLGLRVDAVAECLSEEEYEVLVPVRLFADEFVVDVLEGDLGDVLVGKTHNLVRVLLELVDELARVERAVLPVDFMTLTPLELLVAQVQHAIGVALDPEAHALLAALQLHDEEVGQHVCTVEIDLLDDVAGFLLAVRHRLLLGVFFVLLVFVTVGDIAIAVGGLAPQQLVAGFHHVFLLLLEFERLQQQCSAHILLAYL